MRALLLSLLLTGCIFDTGPDDYDATIDAFEKPRLVLHDTPNGIASMSVNLEPKEVYPGEHGSCPVLAGASAKLGDATLQKNSDGGYDDFWAECEIVQFFLADLPEIAGATVEIHTPDDDLSCSLHDMNVTGALEMRDGGPWSRTNAQPIAVTMSSAPMAGLLGVTSTIRDAAKPDAWLPIPVSSANEVHTITLSGLAPGDYVLRLATNMSMSTDGDCKVVAKRFDTAALTIVAP